MKLKFKPEYLAALDKVAKKHNITREQLTEKINSTLENIEKFEIEIALAYGYLPFDEDFDALDREVVLERKTGFASCIRFETIRKEDTENWQEFFDYKNQEYWKQYDSDRWYPFPEVMPPEPKKYLVQYSYLHTGEKVLATADWKPDGYWFCHGDEHDWDPAYAEDGGEIVAFRSLPDFYEPEAQE
ncbi:hypothetical protein [Turicimonas muris]|uniref:hypothetical protein n=1 Tax=Turicimonas muris TaxID=1796652 RepID=UPI0023EF886C|nr:hypothetical protein [Turicimonas muris]